MARRGRWALAVVGTLVLGVLPAALGVVVFRARHRVVKLRGGPGYAHAVAFSRDGALLAVGGDDGHLALFRAEDGSVAASFTNELSSRGVAFSPDGTRLLAVSHRELRLFATHGGPDPLVIFETAPGPREILDDAAFSPDGKLVAAVNDGGSVFLGDAATLSTREIGRHEKEATAVAFSPFGEWLATSSDDGTVGVWAVASGERILTLSTSEPRPVKGVAFSPRGDLLAACSWDHGVRIWRVPGGEAVRGLVATGSVSGCAFSPSGDRIAGGEGSGVVEIWEIATAERVAVLETGTTDWINRVVWSVDDRIAAALDGGMVYVWPAPP